jgi:hypothetical protein
MTKLNINDIKHGVKVKIRRDLIIGERYGDNTFVSDMRPFAGQWVVVYGIYKTTDDFQFGFFTKEINYGFTIEMVERIGMFKYGK